MSWRGCGLGIFAWHFKRRGVPKWMQEIGPAFGVSVGIVAFIYWPGAKSKRIYRVKTWQEWKRGTFSQTCPPRYVQYCTLSKSGDSSISLYIVIYVYLTFWLFSSGKSCFQIFYIVAMSCLYTLDSQETEEGGLPSLQSKDVAWCIRHSKALLLFNQSLIPGFPNGGRQNLAFAVTWQWTTERLSLRSITLPILLNAYYQSTGEWPRFEERPSISAIL